MTLLNGNADKVGPKGSDANAVSMAYAGKDYAVAFLRASFAPKPLANAIRLFA